jgi:hypothetical protein
MRVIGDAIDGIRLSLHREGGIFQFPTTQPDQAGRLAVSESGQQQPPQQEEKELVDSIIQCPLSRRKELHSRVVGLGSGGRSD